MDKLANAVRLVLLRPRTAVDLRELVRIDGASTYSILFFADGHQLKVALPIHRLVARLPELVRIHKRHLINFDYVLVVYRHQPALRLSTGELLPVARRRRCQVRAQFLSYQQQQLNPAFQ